MNEPDDGVSKKTYRTAPVASDRMPTGIPYIVGNEAAERFSFYGMKAILVVFMTKYLLDSNGTADRMSDIEATEYFHYFTAAVYFTPIAGAILADAFWGKYKTILSLSMIYCLGHLALAIDNTRTGLFIGLSLIAIGAGGIKPCVSAHVGDQFGKMNQGLLPKVMSWFYFSINLGAFASTLLTPYLLDHFGPVMGPHVAFGVPGALMLLATFLFWLGRNEFVHIPAGGTAFLKETFSDEGKQVVARLAVIYFVYIAMFWALYDQTGSMWVLQAEKMNRTVSLGPIASVLSPLFPSLAGTSTITLLSSQIQAANPLLILLMIPLFSYLLYPMMGKLFTVTPLRKMGIGFFLTTLSFALSAVIEQWISDGLTPGIGWQVLCYILLTAGEVMVSITGLEFSYTQAPKTMKSVVMAMWFFSVTIGNLFTALVNRGVQQLRDRGITWLDGPGYYWFFSALMLVLAVLFVFQAMTYHGVTYIQDEEEAT